MKNLEKELYEIVKNFEIDEKMLIEYDISVYTEKNYYSNWYYHSKTRNIVVGSYPSPLNNTEDNNEKVVTYLEELEKVFYEIYLTVCEALESEGYRQIYYIPTVEEFAELAEVNRWEYLKNGKRFLNIKKKGECSMPVNTICDICGKEFNQDVLYSFYPELNEKIKDLKEEYKDFDGMVCIDCYVDHMVNRRNH